MDFFSSKSLQTLPKKAFAAEMSVALNRLLEVHFMVYKCLEVVTPDYEQELSYGSTEQYAKLIVMPRPQLGQT